MKKLIKVLDDVKKYVKADEEKKELKELKAAAKAKALAGKVEKAKKGEDLVHALKKDATSSFVAIPKSKPCLENLSPAAQTEIEFVKLTGKGICSKCHWKSGCMKCDAEKALQYHLKKEFPGQV